MITSDSNRTNAPNRGKTRLARWVEQILTSDLDPLQTDSQLFRQVRILNGLMLSSLALCVPLGWFWVVELNSNYGYVYLIAFLAWGGLFLWLQRSPQVTFVGRAAVGVLFALTTASVLLLGGLETNLVAWYMLMPLIAAVSVGQRDLWFWCLVATLTPVVIYLYTDFFFIAPSPFSAEENHQFSGISLGLGALIVSVHTTVWISNNEQLTQRLDDSVARLKKEANAQRLLADAAMLASSEKELRCGVRRLIEQLDWMSWVSGVCFWDTRDGQNPIKPYYGLPLDKAFQPTPLLMQTVLSGSQSMTQGPESVARKVYYPVKDGHDVVGVIEIESGATHDPKREGVWLLQQIAIQLGHIAERERTAKIIQQEARYDSLTTLNNRRAFQDILDREIAAAQRDEKKIALLFIDLNDFKRINDSLGHASGDEVLRVVAKRLQQSVRQTDTHSELANRAADSISRVGGDEFTLLLENIHETGDVDRTAERILDSLASPMRLNGQQFRVGASIGIAIFPDDAQQADALIRSADAAMYAAKRRGRSGYSRYRDSDKAIDSLSFEADMRRALEEGQLEMHYQPVFDCKTSEPVGAEALVRWHHPERGWIPPSDFIPLAEHTGLIGEIGKFQFETVLHWFKAARVRLPVDFRIALNLSPAQIEDSEFVTWLLKCLADSQLPMSNIELEITETALLADTPEIQATVRGLSDLGLCITLDDFGTGQSSLSLLKRFPIGRIKIDQSFVSGLPDRSEDVAIVTAVLSLARALDIPAVAEGVEEEVQRQFLRQLDCEEMQGYLMAKPMPGDALTRMLTRS